MKTKSQEITFESYLKKISKQNFEKRKNDRYAYNEVVGKGGLKQQMRKAKVSFSLFAKSFSTKYKAFKESLKNSVVGKKIKSIGDIIAIMYKEAKDFLKKIFVDSRAGRFIASFFSKEPKIKEKKGFFSRLKSGLKNLVGIKESYSEEFYNENFNLPFSKNGNPGNVIKITYRVKNHKIIINSITKNVTIEGQNPSSIWEEIFPGKGIKDSYEWKKGEWSVIKRYIEGGSGSTSTSKNNSTSTSNTTSSTKQNVNSNMPGQNQMDMGSEANDEANDEEVDNAQNDQDENSEKENNVINATEDENNLLNVINKENEKQSKEIDKNCDICFWLKLIAALVVVAILLILFIGYVLYSQNKEIIAQNEQTQNMIRQSMQQAAQHFGIQMSALGNIAMQNNAINNKINNITNMVTSLGDDLKNVEINQDLFNKNDSITGFQKVANFFGVGDNINLKLPDENGLANYTVSIDNMEEVRNLYAKKVAEGGITSKSDQVNFVGVLYRQGLIEKK